MVEEEFFACIKHTGGSVLPASSGGDGGMVIVVIVEKKHKEEGVFDRESITDKDPPYPHSRRNTDPKHTVR